MVRYQNSQFVNLPHKIYYRNPEEGLFQIWHWRGATNIAINNLGITTVTYFWAYFITLNQQISSEILLTCLSSPLRTLSWKFLSADGAFLTLSWKLSAGEDFRTRSWKFLSAEGAFLTRNWKLSGSNAFLTLNWKLSAGVDFRRRSWKFLSADGDFLTRSWKLLAAPGKSFLTLSWKFLSAEGAFLTLSWKLSAGEDFRTRSWKFLSAEGDFLTRSWKLLAAPGRRRSRCGLNDLCWRSKM